MKLAVRTKPSWINEQAMIAGTDPPLIALLLLIIRFPLSAVLLAGDFLHIEPFLCLSKT